MKEALFLFLLLGPILASAASLRAERAPHLHNLDDLDDKQAEEMLADMMFNDNDLSEYASISQEDGTEAPTPVPPLSGPDPPPVSDEDFPELSDIPITFSNNQKKYLDPVEAILMVVNSRETRATLALMEPLEGRNNLVQISRNGVTFTVGMYGLYHTAVIKSSPGTEGPNASTQKLIRALGVVKPGFVISVGVGYGINRRKLQMADIIVANIVQDYTYRRIGTESDVIRSPQFPVGARLLDVFDQTAGFKLMRGPDDPVKVKIDPIISGPNLVDSLEEKNKLTGYFPDAEGGEMEGAGIMFAVQSVPNNKPEAIVIKAIVDWADGTKEKSWQPFAAHASASYVLYHMKTSALKGLKPAE